MNRPTRLIDSKRNLIVEGSDLLLLDDYYKVKSIDCKDNQYDICCEHESLKSNVHITGKLSGHIYQVIPEVMVV